MLAPRKKSYDKPRQWIKSWDITLMTKVQLFKAIVFPVAMYGCKSWTAKKAEHWRIDAFELWYWRRHLRVPCQSIVKEINPEYSLKGLMLKLQCFDHLMGRTNSLGKTLMLKKIECRRRTGWQRTRCLDGIRDSVAVSLNKLQEMVKDKEAWSAPFLGITKSRTQLNEWTTT